jgi:hypothetical protein
MTVAIDEATERFLDTARADLQRMLGIAGTIEELVLERPSFGVRLVARVRVGRRTVDMTGTGDSLVSAYHALVQTGPEPIIRSAFEQLLET